jgi:hypothetical protein
MNVERGVIYKIIPLGSMKEVITVPFDPNPLNFWEFI